MSNAKLKFKIISCSSEEQQYPVSSLLFSGSEGWQTRRFCTYPQQITLQFYGVVNIRKIELVSDHRKISSQVDILYYIPVGNNDQRFYKYGYLQFNRNEGNNLREQKTIMVDINCLYLRFLFHKPHSARDNFFSQIGIQSLTLYGSDEPSQVPYEPQTVQQDINEQDAEYIGEIVARLTAEKEAALQHEDFQNANYYKNTIGIIHQLALKLGENRSKIKKALEVEDYDTAKMIKKQIDQYKAEIQLILQTKEKPSNQAESNQQNQFAQKEKYPEQQANEFMENQQPTYQQLSVSRQTKQANERPQVEHLQNYDNRVIPTLREGRMKSQNDELGEQNPKPPPPVQQVQGKFIKEATVMQEYFDQETVKKFFSVHWQHNTDSLSTILADCKKPGKDVGFVKCLIGVVKFSGKQTNFQVSQLSLAILVQLLKINSSAQLIGKPGDLQNDLDEIGKEVIRRLTDNNPKIKIAAESAFAQMIASSLYGVEACSLGLARSKAKLSSKQLTTRLSFITKMIDQYGLAGGSNTVPVGCLDFAIQNVKNPAEQVRRASVGLLSAAYKKDKLKTEGKFSGLKQSIIQQIQQDSLNISQKNKKR